MRLHPPLQVVAMVAVTLVAATEDVRAFGFGPPRHRPVSPRWGTRSNCKGDSVSLSFPQELWLSQRESKQPKEQSSWETGAHHGDENTSTTNKSLLPSDTVDAAMASLTRPPQERHQIGSDTVDAAIANLTRPPQEHHQIGSNNGGVLLSDALTHATNQMRQVIPKPVIGISNAILLAGLFSCSPRLWTRIFWPSHSYFLTHLGVVPALSLTTLLNFIPVTVAMIAFMGPHLLRLPMPYAPVAPTKDSLQTTSRAKSREKLMETLHFMPGSIIHGAFVNVVLILLSVNWSVLSNTAPPTFSLAKSVSAFFRYFVVSDVLTYFLHRMVHQPNSPIPLLRWMTRCHLAIHHGEGGNNKGVIPVIALHDHPLEATLINLAFMAGPMMDRAHPALSLSWVLVFGILGFSVHSEWLQADAGDHATHHKQYNVNFGGGPAMDLLFGTSSWLAEGDRISLGERLARRVRNRILRRRGFTHAKFHKACQGKTLIAGTKEETNRMENGYRYVEENI